MLTPQIRSILRAVTPYGLVEMRRTSRSRRSQAVEHAGRAAFHEARRARLEFAAGMLGQTKAHIDGEDFASVIDYLVQRGLSRSHVLSGSMPEDSLRFVCNHLEENLDFSKPCIGLHIGNFVGVSVTFLTSFLVRHQPNALMIAIDPNLPHRGITNPQEHVAALLSACGLQQNALIIAGYSMQKSISNDGVVFDNYDPVEQTRSEYACELSLRNLARLNACKFDLALLDGNHEAGYLREELAEIAQLMQHDGIVVLDDVDSNWAEIREIFSQVDTMGFKPVATNGRIGVARVA